MRLQKTNLQVLNMPVAVAVPQVGLKCADVGHLAAPWEVHHRWVSGLEEEFFRQGDREKSMHMMVSPLMDRCKDGITKSQVGVGFWVWGLGFGVHASPPSHRAGWAGAGRGRMPAQAPPMLLLLPAAAAMMGRVLCTVGCVELLLLGARAVHARKRQAQAHAHTQAGFFRAS